MVRDPNELLVGELVEAEAAEFAADAGVLHSAERQVGRALHGGVEPDHADVEPVGDVVGLVGSPVKTALPRPYGESLASVIASSTESTW